MMIIELSAYESLYSVKPASKKFVFDPESDVESDAKKKHLHFVYLFCFF